MARLPPLPGVRDLVRLYGLQATRSLSQNFLFNLALTDRIVRAVPAVGELARARGDLEREKARFAELPALVRRRERGTGSVNDPEAFSRKLVLGVRREADRVPPVLEVGPGPGALTRSLFRCGVRRAAVVEKDSRFVAPLEALEQAVARSNLDEKHERRRRRVAEDGSGSGGGPVDTAEGEVGERAESRLKIVRGDILDVAEDSVLLDGGLYTPREEDKDVGVAVIGNLPFAVSTALLLKWIRSAETRTGVFSADLHPFLSDWEVPPVDMVLMFQREVAERIVAPVGSANYSRLSVMTQRWFDARIAFHINPRNFVPQPKVWASVVHLTTRSRNPDQWPIGNHVHTDDVETVCRELFGFRRTMLRSNLKNLGLDAPEALLPALAATTGLSEAEAGTLRPHNLTVEQWCDLTAAWTDWQRGEENPEKLTDL